MIPKLILSLLSIIVLSSCEEKLTNDQAKEAIQKHYDKASLADGSATYEISTIEIISSKKQKGDVWNVKARVKGTTANYSLPHTEGPEDFNYENSYTIERKDNIWQVTSIE